MSRPWFLLLLLVPLMLSSCMIIGSVNCTLTVETEGNGTVVTPGVGKFMYERGSTVALEAVAANGWEFVHWIGEVVEVHEPNAQVFMERDKTVVAVFVQETYSVSGQIRCVGDYPVADVTVMFDGPFVPVQTDANGYWQKDGLYGTVQITPVKSGASFSPSRHTVAAATHDLENIFLDQMEVTLEEDVRVFTAATVANVGSVTEDGGEIQFSQHTPFVAQLAPGQVLIAGVSDMLPQGLMRRVTHVSVDGLTIVTEAATLEDVVRQGVITASQSVPFDQFVGGLVFSPQVQVLAVDSTNYQVEIAVSLPYDVTVSGRLELGASLDVDMEMSWLVRLDSFRCVITADMGLDLAIAAALQGTLNEELVIATYTAPTLLWLSIVPPVFLTLQLDLVVGLQGNVAVGFDTGAQWSRGYTVGFTYDRQAQPSWQTVYQERGTGWELRPPDLIGQAQVKGYAGVLLSGLTYGVAGLYVGAYAYCEAEATVGLNPWRWQYDLGLGLEGAIGARLDVIGIADLVWEPGRLPLLSYPVAYGASGRVVDAAQTGIAAVAIECNQGKLLARTDNDGYWQAHLLSGIVELVPRKQGYAFNPISTVISGSGSDMVFTAEPGNYTVSGSVLDEAGYGLEAATISFSGGHGSVQTNADGYWSKGQLTGVVNISVTKSGYQFSPDSVQVDWSRTNLNFVGFPESGPGPPAGYRLAHTVDGITFWMRMIPSGTFPAGACDTRTGQVGTPVWMAETQVTNELWDVVHTWALGNGYSQLQATPHNAASYHQWPFAAQWWHAVVWCNALSEYFGLEPVYTDWVTGEVVRRGNQSIFSSPRWNQTANGFRLPVEWEWELAARFLGSTEPVLEPLASEALFQYGLYWTPGNYASGASGPAYNPTDTVATDTVAWYADNSGGQRQAVALKQANFLGLYDLSGNCGQWCFDAPGHQGDYRIIRGGDYASQPLYLMVGYQTSGPKTLEQGVRLVRNL